MGPTTSITTPKQSTTTPKSSTTTPKPSTTLSEASLEAQPSENWVFAPYIVVYDKEEPLYIRAHGCKEDVEKYGAAAFIFAILSALFLIGVASIKLINWCKDKNNS